MTSHNDISDAEIEAACAAYTLAVDDTPWDEVPPGIKIVIRQFMRAAILTSRAALLAEGRKVVAREATEEMQDAYADIAPMEALPVDIWPDNIWRAMWDTAP